MGGKAKIKDIRIQKSVYRGFGMGYLYGKPVFLLHTYQDEKVRARVRQKGRKVFRGKVLDIIDNPCPHRIEPPCPYSGMCGGCHYQEVTYPFQLELKQAILTETLTYIGKLELPLEITANPSTKLFRYRPQCGFQIKKVEDVFQLGYFRFESQDFIRIDDCLLLLPSIIEKIPFIEDYINTHAELLESLQYIDVRSKSDGSKIVLTFGCKETLPELPERIYETAIEKIPTLSAILFRAWKSELLIGNGDIDEEVLDNTYRIGAGSFFQNNIFQWEPIQRLVRNHLQCTSDDCLLDLFCGVGFWSIGVGKMCTSVYGYENNERSIALSRANALRNGLENSHFEALDLSQGLGTIPEQPSVVIINPPRSGCSRRLMNEVASMPARKIIYISCDPPSLARDISRLIRKGNLKICSIDFIDMFPNTFSIETAVVLEPQ